MLGKIIEGGAIGRRRVSLGFGSDRIVADCLGRFDWNVGGREVIFACVGFTADPSATGG